jgi:hypothetical protein
MQPAVGLAALALLWALGPVREARAQLKLGDAHVNASAWIETLYTDGYGNFDDTSGHSLGFSGRGTITGDYYNPDFFSYTLLPYYGRSQDNSDTQSITSASGYTGNLNIFKGSHFPGTVNFQQNWNQSGNYGVPGITGLTTVNNNHTFGIGWSELVPGLPTLLVGFGDGGGSSQLLGSPETTNSTMRNFNIASGYNIGRYNMTGGFIHLNDNVVVNGLGNGETDTVNGASNQYHFLTQGPVPYRHSSTSFSFSRTQYSEDSEDGTNNTKDVVNTTTDSLTGTVNLDFPKAPVYVNTIYTDNLLGSIEQQMLSSGQVPLESFNSPESHSLSVTAGTYVNVLPRLMLGGFVERTEEFFDGENFGLTQVGVTANYSFLHMLKGLTFYGGVTDSASQDGNTRVGFIGNVTYNRHVGRWAVGGFFLYNQNTETLLTIYTTSSLNYGGSVKRQITSNLGWLSVANILKSGFNQVSGDNSHAESFTTMLFWKKASISGFYCQSNGMAILTSTGLVNTTVPSQVLPPGAATIYSGRNYGVTINTFPIKHLVINGAWSKALANTTTPTLLSNSGGTNYYGYLGYDYRKLIFTAGVTKFNQFVSTSGEPPTMLTSFSFGVQRWFKGF